MIADDMSSPLITDRVDLQHLGMAMSFVVSLVRLVICLSKDLRQIIDYSFKPGFAQVPFADGEIVWSSLLFDVQVHYAELQNMKMKLYDFSASSLVSRRKSSNQYSRCIDFQAKFRSVMKVLNQCFV